jgi:hypothetical protein
MQIRIIRAPEGPRHMSSNLFLDSFRVGVRNRIGKNNVAVI